HRCLQRVACKQREQNRPCCTAPLRPHRTQAAFDDPVPTTTTPSRWPPLFNSTVEVVLSLPNPSDGPGSLPNCLSRNPSVQSSGKANEINGRIRLGYICRKQLMRLATTGPCAPPVDHPESSQSGP